MIVNAAGLHSLGDKIDDEILPYLERLLAEFLAILESVIRERVSADVVRQFSAQARRHELTGNSGVYSTLTGFRRYTAWVGARFFHVPTLRLQLLEVKP